VKNSYRVLAGAAVVMVAAVGCGNKPNSSASGPSTSTTAAAPGASTSSGPAPSTSAAKKIKGCLVTDTGGIDDRSFNASAWKGMQQAQQSLGADVKYLQSQQQTDYPSNINQFISQGCDLIVTVGFLMGDATKAAAAQHPDQKFAIIDFAYDKPIANVKSLTYQTDQAAFLGGYLAAGMTKTGKVGTFGGAKIPPVTIYMDGFAEGVDYYNQKHGKNVQVLGWNPKTQNGLFTGDFTDQGKGKSFANNLLQQGAAIILPVAGSVGLGAAAAVQQANKWMEWVDTDGCVSAQQYCKLFITSVTKNIANSVESVMKDVSSGSFDATKGYVGTLENDGVGISPYHDFDSQVPSDLKSEVDQLKQDIISGKVKGGSGS
jgi:basic membrane protein A